MSTEAPSETPAREPDPPGSGTIPCVESPGIPRQKQLELLRLCLLQRLTEERAMLLYRQGRIPGSYYTGRGQEAVAAAAGLCLEPDDVAAPLNRELACHFARGVTVADVFRNFLAKATGPTRGRDGNMHFGMPGRGVFPLVSMLGMLCPISVGAALAFKRRGEPRVALTFWGDGAMSTGDVHEGMNLAGVLEVPVVFVIQNNQYAYSTPTGREMVNTNIAERVEGGWSIPCAQVDGTDALASYATIGEAVQRARDGEGPQAVEALSLRMHGHAAHDDGRYVPAELKDHFATRRDPIGRLRSRLELDRVPHSELDGLHDGVTAEVAAGLAEAESAPPADPTTLEEGVYAMPLKNA